MTRNLGKKFLNFDEYPVFWCPGCGNGILIAAIARALEEVGFENKDVVAVTGIGCWGKADDYLKCHNFHGTHGRAIAAATGVKLANPDLEVIAMVGDGDGATIGGNHLIHAARRNIDMTVIMSNNDNYGMTGGQYSATTPFDSITSTSRYGHVEDEFDIAQLVKTAGASYVVKTTITNANLLQRYITKALRKERGFRFIEVVNICPTYFGRYNRLGSAVEMIDNLKKNSVTIKAAEKMSEEELKGKIVVGELVDKEVDGYVKRYEEIQRRASGQA